MAYKVEPFPYSSRRRDESEFNLREWTVKARISRESNNNNNSRRYSGSYIRSFREDTKSQRSNITISSTASSPGYPFKGEVPMECLSSKTLSGRPFRNSTNRITMSAPLVYSSRHIQTKPSNYIQQDVSLQFPIQEKKKEGMTRDVGTQSTPPPPYHSSSSPSPTSTPSIIERSKTRLVHSPNSNSKSKSEEEVEVKDNDSWGTREKNNEWRKKEENQVCKQVGCFSWMMKRKRHKERNKERRTSFSLKGC
ncbi:uncharacterized protein [Cicer arietinum]|uniref:uncharacterized protein isoform X4 n=1 Tax=Cicer arietinum TaxID=3827 RepID=UPI0006417E18